MTTRSGLEALASGAVLSPFTRTRRLLDGLAPGIEPVIDLSLGEPRETMPDFVLAKIKESEALFAKYPPIRGSDELRGAIADWIGRRFGSAVRIDPEREVLPANGSREALFYATLPAVGRKRVMGQPAALMCNPYYQAYLGGAMVAGAEPVFLNATPETGNLPDLGRLEADKELLKRAVVLFICSPANPQGAAADAAYISRALDLARRHDIMLFFDECYSEIYGGAPPVGALQVAAATPERFKNLVVFNSLSKRSNLPGLRSGFAAGDADFLEMLAEVRNQVAPQMPGPIQHASAAVWADEAHVSVNQAAYRAKYDVCDEVLGHRFGYRRPDGGFFLWLEMTQFGGGEAATLTLWKGSGVKVIPGAYLAQADDRGVNPGENFIRVALVHDVATIRSALERIVQLSA
ncbi:MAG: hypothetical protein RLZ98_2461 [Pseudomonadota bacterium]|jgi:aspartate/methionine/tyrosine aminotransferase